MTLSDAKDLATILGVAIALVTVIKGVFEFTQQGAQKRAEQFTAMRRHFKEDQSFKEICDLLETDDPKLREISFKDKRDFLGFFEEIALMFNSGVIRLGVAHYMFGYYAIRCWASENFWSSVNRNSPYWSLFKDFAAVMKTVEGDLALGRRRSLRF